MYGSSYLIFVSLVVCSKLVVLFWCCCELDGKDGKGREGEGRGGSTVECMSV